MLNPRSLGKSVQDQLRFFFSLHHGTLEKSSFPFLSPPLNQVQLFICTALHQPGTQEVHVHAGPAEPFLVGFFFLATQLSFSLLLVQSNSISLWRAPDALLTDRCFFFILNFNDLMSVYIAKLLPHKFNKHSSQHSYKFFFLWWKLLKSSHLATFKYIIWFGKYSDHVVHYIPQTYSPYNWKLVSFDPLLPFSLPQPCISGNHQSILWYPWIQCVFFFKSSHKSEIILYLSFCVIYFT